MGLFMFLLYQVEVPINYIIAVVTLPVMITLTFTLRFYIVANEVRAYVERLRKHTQLDVQMAPLGNMSWWRGAQHGFRISVSHQPNG